MILFLISGCGCIRFFKNLLGYPSFLREQWLYLMKTKRKDVTMQKCREWIRKKDKRKKLLLPVLFFLFLMIGSLLCLPWLRQLMEKQEGWLILAKEHAPWAMLAVIGCITLQVVLAFLPGELLARFGFVKKACKYFLTPYDSCDTTDLQSVNFRICIKESIK